MRHQPHIRLVVLIGLVGGVLASGWLIAPGVAQAPRQEPAPEPGICDGVICGPSGAFSVPSFPTLTDITWDAFPPNPPRPYAPGAEGSAIYVATTGNDAHPGTSDAPLATLVQAAERAQPGDVIWVADGEYPTGLPDEYEALVLETPGITLAAEHPGAVTLVPLPGENSAAVGIAARADDLIIDGFVIRDFREVGIEIGNARTTQHNIVLKHLRVENCDEGIRTAYGGSGRQPVIDGLLVYDVWLHDVVYIAIQCGEGPCNNMRFEALRIETPPSATNENSGADALAVESGENVVVFNAVISGLVGDGIDLKSSRNAVANVIVHDMGRNGIKLWQSGDIINALVYNTGADAAVVLEDSADDYRLLNVTVAYHSRGESAYVMTAAYDTPNGTGRLDIVNSVFYMNSGPVWVTPTMALDVRNTLFYGSANDVELDWGPVVVGAMESPISALEAAGGGSGNLEPVDPAFRDPDAGDFTWTSSPLQDAGTDAIPLPAFDLLGHPRVNGPAVDLGPWEAP